MARSKNKVQPSSSEKSKVKKKFKTRVFPFVAGETKNCHETILRKLNGNGARIVDSIKNSRVVIVFCPIVSRLETDINSALSQLKDSDWSEVEVNKGLPDVILVVMHHTFDKNYTVPPKQEHSFNEQSIPVMHCLFQEREGLLTCSQNETAIDNIREKMRLRQRCAIM